MDPEKASLKRAFYRRRHIKSLKKLPFTSPTYNVDPSKVVWRSSWRLGEQVIAHTKPFFFPVASAATCTDSHLEVDQSKRSPPSGLNMSFLEKWDFFNPEGADPVSATAR
ncbi:hypothetical protein Taro_043220 [Colocasia esculenta]|uniref:Uncharacterized protein n=1 Tax=Colocasia esculenta TaxID=4460 RepID=A0A843WQU3_COLES|nr:hypothetical protein [Colocasia esculenta]